MMFVQGAIRDVRYAMRQLRRSPGFTVAAVLTLALGIASLTTVFTWIKAVAFDPYPHVNDSRSLRFVDATVRSGGSGYNVSYPVLEFLRERDKSLDHLAAFTLNVVDLASPGTPPEVQPVGQVSSNYFQLLGLEPQLGSFFDPGANDRVYGAHDEVVLSDRLWRVRFNADAHIVGRTIMLNRHPFTVIGVAPRDFSGIYGGIAEGLWVPVSGLRSLGPDPAADPLKSFNGMFGGRLRPGVSSETAAAELHTLARQYAQQEEAKGGNMGGWDLNLRDSAHFERGLFGVIGENMPVLLGAAGLLLILVCINTTSLMGQRAARRRREIAIRTSLGATSRRIASQLLMESLILANSGARGRADDHGGAGVRRDAHTPGAARLAEGRVARGRAEHSGFQPRPLGKDRDAGAAAGNVFCGAGGVGAIAADAAERRAPRARIRPRERAYRQRFPGPLRIQRGKGAGAFVDAAGCNARSAGCG